MSIGGKLAKLKWSLRLLGFRATATSCFTKVIAWLGYDLTQNEKHWDYLYHCFDRRFGVETTEAVLLDEIDVEGDQKTGMYHYEPTSPVAFATTFEQLPIEVENYSFVDYGSGKGRALFMAAFFPFKEIIGVELCAELISSAKNNIDSFTKVREKQPRFELVQQNATTFDLPVEPAVLYFFNPFDAEIMQKVVEQIERSWEANPRHLVIVYHNALHREVFDKADFLKVTSETDNVFSWLVYETPRAEPSSMTEHKLRA